VDQTIKIEVNMIAKKNQILKLAGAVLTCAVISACSQDVSNPPPLNSGTASAGDADFTKFVSIGDSLTAGYADGALYLLGQQNSFPNMLSQQFAAVGGGAFEQPLLKHDLFPDPGDPVIDGNLGALLVGTIPDLIESRYVLNTETQSPERLEGTAIDDVVGTGLNGTAFNNMGVPGVKSYHLGAGGYGDPTGLPASANPYYVRFATSNIASVISDAAAQAPSFYTLWIGNNDVLSFATSGGIGAESCDPLVVLCGPNDITDPTAFETVYAQLVGAMTAANPAVQGVLVNIPDVSTIPYFTTVPYNAVPLDQPTADALNAAYAPYNAGVAAVLAADPDEVARRTISFSEGQNAVVILDEDLTDITGVDPALLSMRQATASDLVVLPASSKIGTEATPGDPTTVWGLGMPLEDSDVLTSDEVLLIDDARVSFNATIKSAADADDNLVFFDAAALMTQLSESGISYSGGSISADFVTGGAFSLDGVHATARGYAVIANGIIDTINTGFNANVYKVDPSEYPTVLLK
jgi:lysophospholipase L1-like esterase